MGKFTDYHLDLAALMAHREVAGVAGPRLVARLADAGTTVGGGYGDWKPTTLRIGHMGEVRREDLEALFATIDQLLSEGLD